jgi:hypothetical protein
LVLGLLADEPEVVERLDAAIGTIPGLAGLDLIGRSVRSARDRV